MRVAIAPRSLRLRRPLTTAFGELRVRETLVLELTDEDGVTGRGEAAPLEPYDGVPLHRAARALEAYRPVLEHADERGGAEVLDACRAIADLPQALAAVD